MFAVIKTGGKQYVVSPETRLKIEKLDAEEGTEVVFDDVLLAVDGEKVLIGNPTLKNVKVVGKVERQARADKVVILKYKPKKRYKKKMGHRQPFTEVTIKSIGEKSSKPVPAKESATRPKAKNKKAAKKIIT